MITPTQSVLSFPSNLQTVAEFELWERQHIHEGSYEFVRGRIIPKPAMKQDEFYIAAFLTRLFTRTEAYQQGHELLPEADSYVDGVRKRVPDLAYFTADQLLAIRRGGRVSTRFAIEILSDSESFEDVVEKIQDYFDADAQLVWYIVPNKQRIYVYNSPDESKAYKGSDLISASAVVPGFEFRVEELFG
ncbi:Uma2 family endonuclease [Rudanella lutea]|uniref:Uma2 family endonuclease n=1 Tax=Rudanella lutea TaxID=451374 RepID=UPI00036F8A8C|nr:Uma2 family endonuclease [Rudanella lutea]